METSNLNQNDPANWGLSPQSIAVLSKEQSILTDLTKDRHLSAFSADYRPTTIDVLFDDVPYIRCINGVLTSTRECKQNYQPQFIEYRFDDEIALFQVNGEYVVNRIKAIAEAAQLKNLLNFGGN